MFFYTNKTLVKEIFFYRIERLIKEICLYIYTIERLIKEICSKYGNKSLSLRFNNDERERRLCFRRFQETYITYSSSQSFSLTFIILLLRVVLRERKNPSFLENQENSPCELLLRRLLTHLLQPV